MHSLLRKIPLRLWVAALALLLLLAAPLLAHVALVYSAPAADEELDTAPPRITVRFSGRVEPRYSVLTLLAPDGSDVPLAPIVFADGSDREFSASVPQLTLPGRYTVRWRTAGADGHVLNGSFGFVLTASAVPEPAAGDTPDHAAHTDHDVAPVGHEVHDHEEAAETGGAALPVAARWLHFLALTLIIGAVTFRAVLMPRMDSAATAGATGATLRRRGWLVLGAAAALLVVAAVLRLWLQSRALHGAADAWNPQALSFLLQGTLWGRAWLLQAAALAVLGVGMLLAATGDDRRALGPVILATLALATVPALSGHAAGAAGNPVLAVVNDTVHVLAAGAWLGTLALVLVVALPVITGRGGDGDGDVARVIQRFSPLALVCAAIVTLSGVVNTLLHVGSPAQLMATDYGRVLLLKVGVVALVALLGFINWRVIRPRLGTADATRRLRVSMAAELALAVLVLGVTAVLTGMHRP